MNKTYTYFIVALVIVAVLFLAFGITIGSRTDGVSALFTSSTATPTFTRTPWPTSTRLPTRTPRPTFTPGPTRTHTPTLAPGEFPYSPETVIKNFYSDVGIICKEPVKSQAGGYFWDCNGKDGNNMLLSFFYGKEENKIDFIFAYAVNVYSPSDNQAMEMFSIMLHNAMKPAEAQAIRSRVASILGPLSRHGDEIAQDVVNGYPIAVSGTGVCRRLYIGNELPATVDREIITIIEDLSGLCGEIP